MIYAIKLPIKYELWHVMGQRDNHKGLKDLDKLGRANIWLKTLQTNFGRNLRGQV